MTSFFSAEGGPIWIKFRRLVQNDMSTAVIWSKSKPDVEFQYGGCLGEFHGMSSQSHVSYCRVQSLAKSMSWSWYIAECNNSIRHIENRFSPYFIYICFFNAVWALTSGSFRIVSDTHVTSKFATDVVRSARLTWCQSLFFYFFARDISRTTEPDKHQILQEDGKLAAIEKLSFWFWTLSWWTEEIQ